MNLDKIADKIARQAADDKTYGIDMRVIRQQDKTGGHWTKVVSDTLKYGDGKVKVIHDLGDRVQVIADSPMGGVIGPVTIPRTALVDQVKTAKAITANSSLLESVISQHDLLKIEDRLDEQTWRLVVEVYKKLQQDFMLTNDQQEAINRLQQSIKGAEAWTSALHRNNIFKAAHALGIALPSGMF